MLLLVALVVLTLVTGVGLWLGGLYLMVDRPPPRLTWQAALHGAGGLAGLLLLVAALRRPLPIGHAIRNGAGNFGAIAETLLVAALIAGLLILLTHARRRRIPLGLVATHALLAITGYVLLFTFLTMLH